VVPDAGVRSALAGACEASVRTGSVGTEHLLLGLLPRAVTGRVLGEFEVTAVPVVEVVRQAAWTAPDEAAPGDDTRPLGDLEWSAAKRAKPMNYTGAARAALHRAIASAAAAERAEFGPEDLLDALLAAPNRASEALRRIGVDPRRVRERLAGGPAPERPAIAPELEPTRDAVLGVAPYHVRGFAVRMAYSTLRATYANLARTPVPWAKMDAEDQARRLGHRTVCTAHLVLALLAMHEVTRDLPHLVTDVADRYAGVRALVGTGATYTAARAVLAAEPPGRDPRRYRSYVDGRSDTTQVVRAILDGDTSASRLLVALGVAKPDLGR
jgi:hypothetical protein